MLATTYFWVHISVGSLSLLEMDHKFKFGWTIGYGDSYLEYTICHSKVFRFHAILHDAAGAVKTHSGKGPGYCYMIERGPNSCLLSHMTGLLFCFYVKLFLPSIFNTVDFWSIISCTLLQFQLTDKDVKKELGVIIDGNVQGDWFRPPRKYKYKPTMQAAWCTRNLHGIVWNSGRLN